MAIVEGPFQNIIGARPEDRSPFMVSCNIRDAQGPGVDLEFIRVVQEDGTAADFNIPQGYRLAEKDKQGALNLPKSGGTAAFPIINLTTFIAPGYAQPLRKVGFATYSSGGSGPGILYSAVDLFYVGRFENQKNKFVYVVLGGPDAGLYVASLNSNGGVQVLSYAPYLDLTFSTSDFNPDPDAVAANIELPGNPLGSYFSEPGAVPAIVRIGIGRYVAIAGDSVVVVPRTLLIRETKLDGTQIVTQITPAVILSSSLNVSSVSVDRSIPDEPIETSDVVPHGSSSGYFRVPDSTSFFSDIGDLVFRPNGTFISLSQPAGFVSSYDLRGNLLTLRVRRESGSFGFTTAYRRFQVIDFVNLQIREETEEYSSITNGDAITSVIANEGDKVMFSTSHIFFLTKRSSVFTGSDYEKENSFNGRISIRAADPITHTYGVFL